MTAPPLHHIGYVVDDLEAAVARFAATYGAGPFFAIEHMHFDAVSYLGGPAQYDHSSAFGQWGPIIVELSQVHAAEPSGLRDALVKPGGGIGHVAWLCDSLSEETARLEAAGFRAFHAGRTGPASAVWFDGAPLLGHPVEVLERRPEILGFYAGIAAAAEDWDGREELRSASVLFS
jgi:catechol 2,3-dioxygenase-like lactoylglutathione lyase family enzyme